MVNYPGANPNPSPADKQTALNTVENLKSFQYTFYLEGGHGDGAVSGFFHSPDVIAAEAKRGTKHFAVEIPKSKQGLVDRLWKGEISKEKFVSQILNDSEMPFERQVVPGETTVDFKQEFADFIVNSKAKGIKVHCVDPEKGRFVKLHDFEHEYLFGKMLAIQKRFGEQTPAQIKDNMRARVTAGKQLDGVDNLALETMDLPLKENLPLVDQCNNVGMFKKYLGQFAAANKLGASDALATFSAMKLDDKLDLFTGKGNDPHSLMAKNAFIEREGQNKEIADNIKGAAGGELTGILYGMAHGISAFSIQAYLGRDKTAEILVVRDAQAASELYTQRGVVKPEQYQPITFPGTTIIVSQKSAQIMQHSGIKLGDEVNLDKESLEQYLGSFKPMHEKEIAQQSTAATTTKQPLNR